MLAWAMPSVSEFDVSQRVKNNNQLTITNYRSSESRAKLVSTLPSEEEEDEVNRERVRPKVKEEGNRYDD